jgi:hypothetical protein
MSPELLALSQSAIAGLFAGGGVWAAIRVEIRLLWREADMLHKRIDRVEKN